jgi:hypothetical protein
LDRERADEQGHANRNTVAHLFSDGRLRAIGDLAGDFEAANNRTRV